MSDSWRNLRAPESETNALKFGQIATLYGIPSGGVNGELDHLIPRFAGGTNSAANLWDEQDGAIPNRKDVTAEFPADRWMCALMPDVNATMIRIHQLQQAFAQNWQTVPALIGQ